MTITAQLPVPTSNGRVTVLDPLTHALADPAIEFVQSLGSVELIAELASAEAAVAGADTFQALLELIRREAQIVSELSRRRTVLRSRRTGAALLGMTQPMLY